MKKDKDKNKEKGVKDTSKDTSIAKEVLLHLLVGGGLLIGVANPALLTPAIFIAHCLKNNTDKDKEKKVKRAFFYLKNNKHIAVKKSKGGVHIELTQKGREKASTYRIQSKLLKKKESKKKWNGIWHVVIFDIDDGKRIKRDELPRLLSRSCFQQLQKSVWIYPFECEKEISWVKEFFSIGDDECRVITSNSIGNDKKLQKEFKLTT